MAPFFNLRGQVSYAFVLFMLLCTSAYGQIGPERPLTQDQKQAIIAKACSLLTAHYVFPGIAQQTTQVLTQKLKGGQYSTPATLAGFLKTVNVDLLTLTNDKHVQLHFNPTLVNELRRSTQGNTIEKQSVSTEFAAVLRYNNYGLSAAQRLDGNIGYLNVGPFMTELGFSRNKLRQALNFVQDCDALLIDLRQTRGGPVETVSYFCSAFFNQKTLLGQMYRRTTNDTLTIYTTVDDSLPKLAHVPLYILVSPRTASGAEAIADYLQQHKKAIVVGEQTRGAGNPGLRFPIDDELFLFVPTSRGINAVTHKSFEGVGVPPDVRVAADQALLKAHSMALTNNLANVKEPDQPAVLKWRIERWEAQLSGYQFSPAFYTSYAGRYGLDHEIQVENGQLMLTEKAKKRRLVPLKEGIFELEGYDWYRVRFERNAAGKVVKLITYYDDGKQDAYAKDK